MRPTLRDEVPLQEVAFGYSSRVVDYGDRREATIGGQANCVEAGHLMIFGEDSEAVGFAPTAKLERTLAAGCANAPC